MADNAKSFADLVGEAPLYTKSSTVTLTGALARSPEDGKFVLVLADGSDVTLDTEAVQEYTVLGGSFGQQLVQLSVDAARVPQEVMTQAQTQLPTTTINYLDNILTNPINDLHTVAYQDHKLPILDRTTVISDFKHPMLDTATIAGNDQPTVPGLGDPDPDPFAQLGSQAFATPFALAAPHHISAPTLAQMEVESSVNPALIRRTGNHWDYIKTPAQDGTRPVYVGGRWVTTSDY